MIFVDIFSSVGQLEHFHVISSWIGPTIGWKTLNRLKTANRNFSQRDGKISMKQKSGQEAFKQRKLLSENHRRRWKWSKTWVSNWVKLRMACENRWKIFTHHRFVCMEEDFPLVEKSLLVVERDFMLWLDMQRMIVACSRRWLRVKTSALNLHFIQQFQIDSRLSSPCNRISTFRLEEYIHHRDVFGVIAELLWAVGEIVHNASSFCKFDGEWDGALQFWRKKKTFTTHFLLYTRKISKFYSYTSLFSWVGEKATQHEDCGSFKHTYNPFNLQKC